MDAGNLILRDDLTEFERNFASYVGSSSVVGVASGYDALYLGLKALGVGPGDKVAVPAHTHVSTCSAIVNNGAVPVLVDIRDDFNIDPNRLSEAAERNRDLVAVIPVHMNGLLCDMPSVMRIAHDHGLRVVEDACQGIGASFAGKKAGTWGELGCFSFYPFKTLGCYGDGGAVTASRGSISELVRLMRFNGEDRETGRYICHGASAALDNLQAAFLSLKLSGIDELLFRRKQLACAYSEALGGVGNIVLPSIGSDEHTHGYQNFVIRSRCRDDLQAHLAHNGIETMVHWRVPYYRHKGLGLHWEDLPVVERMAMEMLSLPLYPELEDSEQEYVVDCVRSFFR